MPNYYGYKEKKPATRDTSGGTVHYPGGSTSGRIHSEGSKGDNVRAAVPPGGRRGKPRK